MEMPPEFQTAFDQIFEGSTGPKPLLDERRLIDGVWHVWCGKGWIAECYTENVVWRIQVTKERAKEAGKS